MLFILVFYNLYNFICKYAANGKKKQGFENISILNNIAVKVYNTFFKNFTYIFINKKSDEIT